MGRKISIKERVATEAAQDIIKRTTNQSVKAQMVRLLFDSDAREKARADTHAQQRQKRQITPAIRASLVKWYGADAGNQVKSAEAFEICEYGRQPAEADIKQLLASAAVLREIRQRTPANEGIAVGK